jgi:serine/threonine protein kinase
MPVRSGEELQAQTFSQGGRTFLRGVVPAGVNQGLSFSIAQPLADRYRVRRFFASGGMGLLLEGIDLRTEAPVLIKSILRYDVVAYARVRDREGFTHQLRIPRKTLEMERRILVLLRNAGCNAVPHPNDFVFDRNPQLVGPHPTEDGSTWRYDDEEMIDAEPYLIMEALPGRSLEEVLRHEPGGMLSEGRSLRIMRQVTEVLCTLHQPIPMREGMTWQLIYQDLKPANVLVAAQDRVSLLDLGGCQLLNKETGQKLLSGACTSGYCPPECEQPYGTLTPAADVYTVGSNLFHLLSGRSPLDLVAATLGSTQPRAVRLDVESLRDHCRGATREVIARCLAPTQGARYLDARALAQSLDGIIDSPDAR